MSSSPGRGREPREGLLDLVHEIGVVTRPDASLPPEQRLRRSMQAYFDLVERRAAEYRQIYRLEIGADPELRALSASRWSARPSACWRCWRPTSGRGRWSASPFTGGSGS
jgi:hypothetical protein